MAQVGNNENRFGGEFMIQDRDHMSEIDQSKENAGRGKVRQSEQSQSKSWQHGADDNSAGRQQGDQRRQNH